MKTILITICMYISIQMVYAQNECSTTSKPIPEDGYKITDFQVRTVSQGCIKYWIEYNLSTAKLYVSNLTDRALEITDSAIHWRGTNANWKDYYIKPGETKERIWKMEVWSNSPNKPIPKPSAGFLTWRFYN